MQMSSQLTRGIAASSQTLHLDQRKLSILGRLTGLDVQVVLDGVENLGRSTASQLAWCSGAKLDKVGCDGFSVVHGVKRSDLN